MSNDDVSIKNSNRLSKGNINISNKDLNELSEMLSGIILMMNSIDDASKRTMSAYFELYGNKVNENIKNINHKISKSNKDFLSWLKSLFGWSWLKSLFGFKKHNKNKVADETVAIEVEDKKEYCVSRNQEESIYDRMIEADHKSKSNIGVGKNDASKSKVSKNNDIQQDQ